MRPKITSEFITKALDIFHKLQNDIDSDEFNPLTEQLYKSISKTKEHNLISLEDLRYSIRDDPYFQWETTFYDVSDERFTNRFKSTVLTTKTFDFYVPIYCLYEFPKGMAIANTTVLTFEDLPKEVQKYFVNRLEFKFSSNKEYFRNKSDCINLKNKTTFVHFTVKYNGKTKAIEKAKVLVEDALHILRFVYQLNFNLIDARYVIRESGDSGGMEDLASLPDYNVGYMDLWGKSVKVITKIFTKEEPNKLEERIQNAVRIFGTQTAIPNIQVRFLLLMTCLESLLMLNKEKDYLSWKLAEKTAFLLGGDRRKTNKYIKQAYDKRSGFVHGDIKGAKPITEEDIPKAEQIVGDVIWKLAVVFLREGYTQIECNNDSKSINEYIDQQKFGKMIDTTFDFYTDSNGKDPDSHSPTLKRYHKLLWSKLLPNGRLFDLRDDKEDTYLYHKSELGEFFLGSDAITHSYKYHKRKRWVTQQVPEAVNQVFSLGSTIGAYIIFPNNKVDNKQTINGARGCNSKIDDRFDLTLECIRRFYLDLPSPLYDVLLRYQGFFNLFEDFRGYVDFFLLQDLVSEDYGEVKFYLPFDDFKTAPTFRSVTDYLLYQARVIDFIAKRNRRIDKAYCIAGS